MPTYIYVILRHAHGTAILHAYPEHGSDKVEQYKIDELMELAKKLAPGATVVGVPSGLNQEDIIFITPESNGREFKALFFGR